MQFVLAFTYYYRRLLINSIGLGFTLTILGAAAVLLWGAAVNMLNHLAMHNAMRRMLFLLVLLPGVVAVMVALPLGLMLANRYESMPGVSSWFMAGPVLVLILGMALRYLAAWLVKDAPDPSPPPWLAKTNPRPSVIVVDYDPAWPQVFENLRSRVSEVVSDIAISIEHVGSTAVPGLAAKPVIDMGIVVPSEIEIAMAINRLAALGYIHRGDLGIAGREAFRSTEDLPQHNLYLYIQGNAALANHLSIRDHLRQNPAAVAAYGKLKKDLARRFPGDIDSYVAGKTDFLLAILRAAVFSPEQRDAT